MSRPSSIVGPVSVTVVAHAVPVPPTTEVSLRLAFVPSLGASQIKQKAPPSDSF